MIARFMPALMLAGAATCAAAQTTYSLQWLPASVAAYPGPLALLNDGGVLRAAPLTYGTCPPNAGPNCVPPLLTMEVRRVDPSGTETALVNTQVAPASPWGADYGVSANARGRILFQPRQGGPAQWWQDGVRTDLPALVAGTQDTWRWVSNGDALLGLADTTLHLRQGDAATAIPAPPDSVFLSVAGINSSAGIATTVNFNAKPPRAALWSQGRYKTLPFPLLTFYRSWSQATAVNDAGDVVGAISGATVKRAALWRNGWAYDLGTFGGYPSSKAVAVSSTGVVLACAFDFNRPNDFGQLFVWDRGTKRGINQVVTGLENQPDLAARFPQCNHLAGEVPSHRVLANQKGQFMLPSGAGYVILTPRP